MSRRTPGMSPAGFSLLELLVAVAITAMLMAFSWPMLQKAVEASRSSRCAGNLRACATAIFAHAADNAQRLVLPYASSTEKDLASFPQLVDHPQQGKAWYEFLIARGYLGDRALTLCPACAPTVKTAAWGASYGMRRSDNTSRYTPIHLADTDLSRTLLLVDSIRPSNERQWYYVTFKGNATDVIHCRHFRKANVLFCDGSVRQLAKEEIMQIDTIWRDTAFLPDPAP